MVINIIFAIIGAFIGISQYVCTKIMGKGIATGKKEDILFPIIVKLVVYGLVIGAMLLFFDKHLVWCLGGIATGILLATVIDLLKNKKAVS